MLEFEGEWRFESPGPIGSDVKWEFRKLIDKISIQGPRKTILEHFKKHYSLASGTEYYQSSNESWAESDLESVMSDSAENAAVFIETFYDVCNSLEEKYPEIAMPDINILNRILSDADVGFQINPPRLVSTR